MTCLYAFFGVDRRNFESKVVLAQWVSVWRTTTPFRGARLLEEEQEQGGGDNEGVEGEHKKKRMMKKKEQKRRKEGRRSDETERGVGSR